MDLTTYRKFKNLVTSAPRTQTTWSELGGLHVFYFDLNHVVTAKLKPRIYKEGLTEIPIILCKPNKSLLESSKSVGIHRLKNLYSLKNL